jgi:hypothetical protein
MTTRSFTTQSMIVSMLALGTGRAQDVAPPPKPADNGPSLEVTMKFIQDKLNEQGEVNYTVRRSGGDDRPMKKMKKQFDFQRGVTPATASPGSRRESDEVTGAVADPRTCQVSLRKGDGDYRFTFKDAEKLMVMPLKDALNRASADLGEPQNVEEVVPDISALLVQFKGKKLHRQSGRQASDELVLRLVFREDEMAQRMAKAMVHAIELCGGGSKDPF